MSTALATRPATTDDKGKVIEYGYRVTASKGPTPATKRLQAWVDKLLVQYQAESRAAMPAAAADV